MVDTHLEHGRRTPAQAALDVVRGALIGTAETVPGVSGGTVALMTGVYETLLTSAGHAIAGIREGAVDLVRGRGLARARAQFANVRWAVLLPVLIGMGIALVSMAHVMETLVTEHPETMRGFFLGLVLASLAVPYRHATASSAPRRGPGRLGAREWAIAAAAAVVVAVILSLPVAQLEPAPYVLVPAGAIAVSALVLPGLSGSFLLLTMGLYEPTLEALNDRDLGYLAQFAVGAVIGLVSIVKLLQWLLEHHRRLTLVILTGVMAGSLVALWPWQDDARGYLAPTGSVAGPLLATLGGFAIVVIVLIAEHRLLARREAREQDAA
ncbi:DUF368 domain-containing protein [Demequina sp. SYSU T00039]|uniref:DUF368 domain-containing protein n=1 Tax=Demequina lignilytica TaxID=3051663 RepID=A0AAW7M813_9MICO|nr:MULTISPECIES: DUF368 domain-containing protein [unclassified Demequina]MDN4478492.1 DUF368 domain-containing protein [Demequina sp. SYSU T00039-1]MDN4487001.1 DUF368 domain-containing protein [Demequina sp. SYSU T00039]